MASKPFFGAAILAGVVLATASRADIGDQLLQKFKQQNTSAAAKLKADVASNLADAQSAGADPDKAAAALGKNLKQLQEDTLLPLFERASLIRSVQDRLAALRSEAAAKQAKQPAQPSLMALVAAGRRTQPATAQTISEKSASAKPKPEDERIEVGQVAVVGGNAAITPVVSADRRFVRIGLNGSFFMPRINYVPVQQVVPTVLYGPNGTFTVGPPFNVFQVFLPQVAGMATIGLNTTVSVPVGGTAVVGGYSTLAETRSEFGVPVLSRIPYLSRLFRNTSYSRTGDNLQIQVAPRVIILAEEEAKLLGR